MKKILYYCILCSIFSKTYAQYIQPYTPFEKDTVLLNACLQVVNTAYEKEKNSSTRKEAKGGGAQQEQLVRIKNFFASEEILSSKGAQQYLNAVTNKIIQCNPTIQLFPIQCVFSQSAVPNAASWGNGFIVFNIGLFRKLDNESELAFILCHEIAHAYLNHRNNSIKKEIEIVNDKNTQKELRQIKKQVYNKKERFENLANRIVFSNRRYSRANETEADSLSVVLMAHVPFDVKESLSCLSLLDSVDNETFDVAALLKQQFDSKEYPFKERWLEKEEGLLGGHAVLAIDKKLADSLKTHPDCLTRKKQLQYIVHDNDKQANYSVDITAFSNLKAAFSYEIVNYYFNSKQYALCLYHAFELLKEKPSDAFAIAFIGKTFNALYDAQKNHTLDDVADRPAPSYPANYNTLLQFIQNLRLQEIASINYHFLKKHESYLSQYDEYSTAFVESKKRAGKQF